MIAPRLPIPPGTSEFYAPCAYCKREDSPDLAGRCRGCGARRRRGRKIDVTNVASERREYVWVYDV